jgi:hypothetical protein
MKARCGDDFVSDRWSVVSEEFVEELEEPEGFIEKVKK